MSMYNRLFTKILDSSIWLEPLHIRVVWITFLAAMDQDGFVELACAGNVARRAGVSLEDAENAIVRLSEPDPNSSDPANDGRRIERVPGGYIVLNAMKYKEIFNREIQRERTRQRVAKHRANVTPVTECSDDEGKGNKTVTQSEASTYSYSEAKAESKAESEEQKLLSAAADEIYELYPRKVGRPVAIKAILKALKKVESADSLKAKVKQFAATWNNATREQLAFCPHPATWFNQERFNDDPATWTRQHDNSRTNDTGPSRNAQMGITPEQSDEYARERVAAIERRRIATIEDLRAKGYEV